MFQKLFDDDKLGVKMGKYWIPLENYDESSKKYLISLLLSDVNDISAWIWRVCVL